MSGQIVTAHLSDEETRRLDLLCSRDGLSRAEYVRQALDFYFDEVENLDIVEARAEAARRGEAPTFSFEQVMTELGLED